MNSISIYILLALFISIISADCIKPHIATSCETCFSNSDDNECVYCPQSGLCTQYNNTFTCANNDTMILMEHCPTYQCFLTYFAFSRNVCVNPIGNILLFSTVGLFVVMFVILKVVTSQKILIAKFSQFVSGEQHKVCMNCGYTESGEGHYVCSACTHLFVAKYLYCIVCAIDSFGLLFWMFSWTMPVFVFFILTALVMVVIMVIILKSKVLRNALMCRASAVAYSVCGVGMY